MYKSHAIPNAGAQTSVFLRSRKDPQRAEEFRRDTIASVVEEIRPNRVWDLCGNGMSYRNAIQDQGINWINCELEVDDGTGSRERNRNQRPDLVIAFGILHRLRITANVSLTRIAHCLENLADWILIEFVPKEDSTVRALLRGRPESFEDYYLPNFYAAFRRQFEIVRSVGIPGTQRSIYLFKSRAEEVAAPPPLAERIAFR